MQMADHIEIGKQGEVLAVEYLQGKGFQILEQNWHNHHQEVDIIATKGSELVIVEVKCRTGTPLVEPQFAVNRNKQNLLIKAANAYIKRNNIDLETRFDVISITLGKETIIDHIENAFYPRLTTVRKLFNILIICGLSMFFAACGSSSNQGTKYNKPVLYNPSSSSLHPKLGVFHVSDVESQLYIMINTNELLASEANQEGKLKAEIKIHYQLFDCTDIENNKLVSDSSTFVNSVEMRQQQKIIVFPIMIPAENERRYLLSVQTSDLLRRNTVKQFISINKTNIYSAQNFKLTVLNGGPKLDYTISENDIISIDYRRRLVDKLYIKYMNVSQVVATSPLSIAPAEELQFKADSIWIRDYSPATNFIFGYEGLYFIQTDTTQQDGLLLMNFGASYPVEDRTEQLVQPIQYLLNENEYQRLSAEKVPKKMMDNYWLAATGSTDKARMLIRVFYTRMSYANQFFTDYKEGWKTERGMIYMIYGLPNNINKGSHVETWEYTRKQQANPITFVFEKKPSPYSENYYLLRRGDAQPTYWRQAVESWRKGRVFNVNDLE